jgi:predicted transcriptional regulator
MQMNSSTPEDQSTESISLRNDAPIDGLQPAERVVEGIHSGERAIEEGRILSHKDARKRVARWLTP